MKQVSANECDEHLITGLRFIDVRAPVEFAEGSLPGSVNLPLLTNDERHQIGVVYKAQGQVAAIELGHRLVNGSVKSLRVEAWLKEIKAHPDAIIFCFRGGLRSQTVQSWLQEAHCAVPIVEGGYKALRRYLIETIDVLSSRLRFQVICGPTGSGKTDFIKSSGKPFIDLEELAKHRGSAFGALTEPQPTQIDFENALAVELLKQARAPAPILIEDESAKIGQRLIPPPLFRRMQKSERMILDVSLETRVDTILKDYVVNTKLGQRNDVNQFDLFRTSVTAISRKLGGARAKEILTDIDRSQREFENGNGLDSNRVWIRKLLEWYYDPCYLFALQSEK